MPGMPPKEMLQSSQESIPNAQTPPRESRKHIREMREGTNHRRDSSNGTNGRPRKPQRSDKKTALEMSVKKSEESIAKLQEHLDNNTCPKTLRYSAWQKIRPDPEFKSDINKIRKEVERKLLGALKKFHYRSVERNRLRLRELERKSRSRNLPSTSNNTDVKRYRAKNRDSNVTTNVQRSASNILKQNPLRSEIRGKKVGSSTKEKNVH